MGEKIGTIAPFILLGSAIVFWAVPSAIGHLSAMPLGQHSSTIMITKTLMTIDGKSIPIITSRFTPTGTFTIGTPFRDETLGAMAYPFLSTSWRSMPSSNPLKTKIQRIEEKTGEPQNVAYSIHAGSGSDGCVVLPTGLDEISSSLEGRQIRIDMGRS